MTTTTATDSAGLSVYKPTANVGTGSATMDQSSFLTLLTAQMQFQDPFEPVKNSDMVAQMATITNSSGIAEMNASIKTLTKEMTGTRLGDAASWIGKSMLVNSNIAAPDVAGTYAGQVTLPAATDGASIDLVDAAGNTVKTIDMGPQQAGDVTFYWDGKNDAGQTVSTSALQVKVNGATPTRVATWATIAAVQSPADGSSSKLITALGSYSPSDAISLM
ncbi:flagellar hook assembly protein FlgD [Sphingobium sp. CCH11-B1]|jgi:flagellar basal-body rod modification protein FlgD|uniref:flagellar hook assembly protein FlgD n=1 Tax=Sphingobium sp. CCH11-B1 TaxID=1768781 RepID=UPI0008309087|nr:flagellar hook capping FlgD N-terminal domain-containing protein [Sphingobium sp. CCH11-B1]MEA3388263.1 FlgD immunoglobulin-like domain containing protein [Pseudomonadota bacterium]